MPHKDKENENNMPITPNTAEFADADGGDSGATEAADEAGGFRAELTELEQKLAELGDRHLRMTAEYDNYRKRTARERDNMYNDAQAGVITAFLGVADNFDRAMEAPCSDPDFKKGMELIHSGFADALARLGVEKFAAPGDKFDPECHAALAQVADESAEPGIITQVYSPGYRLGDKVLRPAAVIVAG